MGGAHLVCQVQQVNVGTMPGRHNIKAGHTACMQGPPHARQAVPTACRTGRGHRMRLRRRLILRDVEELSQRASLGCKGH